MHERVGRRAAPAPATQELLLPGAVTPFADASIYARTSGYLQHWNTDIGAQVKQGQMLAVIQTPEAGRATAAGPRRRSHRASELRLSRRPPRSAGRTC